MLKYRLFVMVEGREVRRKLFRGLWYKGVQGSSKEVKLPLPGESAVTISLLSHSHVG